MDKCHGVRNTTRPIYPPYTMLLQLLHSAINCVATAHGGSGFWRRAAPGSMLADQAWAD